VMERSEDHRAAAVADVGFLRLPGHLTTHGREPGGEVDEVVAEYPLVRARQGVDRGQPRGLLDDSRSDGMALGVVAVQEPRRRLVVRGDRELPAEVERVLHPCIGTALSGTNLIHADLRGASLDEANLINGKSPTSAEVRPYTP
jgi:hypothetical protein